MYLLKRAILIAEYLMTLEIGTVPQVQELIARGDVMLTFAPLLFAYCFHKEHLITWMANDGRVLTVDIYNHRDGLALYGKLGTIDIVFQVSRQVKVQCLDSGNKQQ